MAAPSRRRVVLLGATGSVGRSTLRVIEAHPDELGLAGIAAGKNWKQLAEIATRFRVPHAAVVDEAAYREAKASGAFPPSTRLIGGPDSLVELAKLPEVDTVLVAVLGTAGLDPALAALAAGRTLALASKEILVMAGRFVMEAAKRHSARIVPVDSEHNAVFQCLEGPSAASVRRVVLTASGGAFRDWPVERLAEATPAEALRHPNWSMGPKITVDSATLANKGLELIEAQWLFGLKPSQCDAVIHPQSIVHCLVEFADGAMLAQLCPPSMTFPIQHALLYPDRKSGTDASLDLERLQQLEFRPVDAKRFPMLRLARQAMEAGEGAPAAYNAANEVAVAAFLEGHLPFLAIPAIVEQVLASQPGREAVKNLADVMRIDSEARKLANERIGAFVSSR